MNLDVMSASQITAGIKAGEFTAFDVAQAAFAAIEARDEATHSFLEYTPELALEAARRIDALVAAGKSDELGALAGVPCGFKDNMQMIGTRTTCGSKMLEEYDSSFDATCVRRMLDADVLPMGKMNMDEFAFGGSTENSAFGPTHNPWDLDKIPGGSSGGSAAAVSSGMCTITLGSDTGGSIRQPASLCGVVGMKPTYGMVSRSGVVAFGSSLDQVGPFGRCVEDVALSMNALVGRDPLDCTSQDYTQDFMEGLHDGVEGMTIGVCRSMIDNPGCTDEVREAILAASKKFEEMGANVIDVELPHAESAISAYYVLGPCEAFSNLSRFDSVRYGYRHPGCSDLADQTALSRAEGFGPEVRRRVMLGSYLLSAGVYDKYYAAVLKIRTLITEDYQRAYEKVDAILIPTSPLTAWSIGSVTDPTQMYLSDMYTISINIAGNAGISVPIGLGKDTGLPIGAQLVGAAFDDKRLLRVAAALESAYGKAVVAPDFAGKVAN